LGGRCAFPVSEKSLILTVAFTTVMLQSISAYKMYVGGKWIDSESGRILDVVYPYTGEVWARVPRGTASDVDVAVKAAREAFESGDWNRASGAVRGHFLHRLGDLIKENAEHLAEIETMQNGKLIREMLGQMKALPDYFYYFAGLADKIEGRTIPYKDNFLIYTIKEPVGVVAAITPWNSPLLLLTFKLAPGLAAGNTFVVKPSKHTPVSTLELARLAEQAGFPPGVVNVLTGNSDEVGNPLTKHPGVDKIAFTGATDTGIEIARSALSHLSKITLELGGKSPNIVFDDADIDSAVNGVISGIFAATGQTCVAGSRLLVQEGIYDRFIEKLVQRTKLIKLGDPMDPSTEMGTVAFKEQLEKIEGYVDAGVRDGGKIVCGGKRSTDPFLSKGLFFEPTILEQVSNEQKIAQEEIFGPVLCAMKFKDEDGCLRLANDTNYGLAAGIWTKDIHRAHRIAKGIKAGTVWVNCYRSLSYAAPFGGYKNSGIGRENGIEALNEYTQVKTVWVETSGKSRDPFKLG